MAECEFPDGGIERKSVDTSFCRIYEHGRGAVDDIAGGHLPFAFLQKVIDRAWFSNLADSFVNPKDCSNGNIDINIAASIKWINYYHIFGLIAQIFIKSKKSFSSSDASPAQLTPRCRTLNELIVCKFIQFLNRFILNICLASWSKNINESCFVYFYIYAFCGKRNIAQEVTQFTGCIWKRTEFLLTEFLEG